MRHGEIDGPPSRHVIARTIDYILNVTEIVTEGAKGDLLTAVIYLAISRANLSASFANPRTARRHAGVAEAPTHAVRQPVSVLAIAKDLELPYETTRRHVGKLVSHGLCRRVADGGLVIPDEVATGDAAAQGIDAIWRETLWYVCAMGELGVACEARRRRIAPDIRRITSRFASYYVLDILKLARTQVGMNIQTALLALAIMRSNALQPGPEETAIAGDSSRPALRGPVTTHALALKLKTPYETVRRQVGWLEAAGLCERQGRALVMPLSTLSARPELRVAMEANWAETRRLLEALASLGLGAAEARRACRRA